MHIAKRGGISWCARGVSILALLACGTVAWAQEASPAPAGEPEAQSDAASQAQSDPDSSDIIVTAQRRSERLQEVPIAITALSGEGMAERGLTDLSTLRGVVPGLTISTFAGYNASNLVSLRGVSGQPLPIGGSQATALYVDGVFLSRPDAAFFSLDDVERIEVLRGPQGTLYGRNATAGAINIITRTPDDTFTGGLQGSYGNYDTVMFRGSLAGPLGAGLSASISGAYDAHDGYFINTVTGNRVGEQFSATGRLKLRYASDGGFEAVLSADYTKAHSHDQAKRLYDGSVFVGFGDPRFLATDIENRIFNHRSSYGFGLVMNAELPNDFVLTSISSYRKINAASAYDSGGSALADFVSTSRNRSESISQELRGVYSGDGLRLTFGGNYFREKALFILQVNPPPPPAVGETPRDTSTLDALAAFGQVEVDLLDKLTLVGGLRFNHENRDFLVDYTQAFPTRALAQGGKVKDTALLPSGGINYKPAGDILLYGKISKGYQAPGFNFAPGIVAPPSTYAFGPETLLAYELGAKTQFWDRRITLNAALFWYDSKDVQIRSASLPVGATVVSNAASATTKGFEVDFSVRPVDGLMLTAQTTYSKAVFGNFCERFSGATPLGSDPQCSPGIAQRRGNTLVQAPRWSGGTSVNYELPIGEAGKINANLTYSFQSKVFYSTANLATASNNGWHRLDAKLGYAFDNGLEIYAYGRNLTDDRYLGFFYFLGSFQSGVLNDPRTYGVGARFRF